MGDPIAVYGLKFTYNEALLIKQSSTYKEAEKKYKKDYGIHDDDDLDFDSQYSVFFNTWEHLGQWLMNDTMVSFIPDKKYSYSTENESNYFVGVSLIKENIEYIKELDTEFAKKFIEHVCKEVGLPYSDKEFKLHYSVQAV